MDPGSTPRQRGPWSRVRRAEQAAWLVALVLGAGWGTSRAVAWASEQRALAAFRALERGAVAAAPIATAAGPTLALNQSLWDPSRVRAYARALGRPSPPPLAVLRIPRLGLEVPVLEGTDEWTLDRAVGHIEGTELPGAAGNAGIAGHRDGFFRVLKDIAEGDRIEVALPHEVRRFRVHRISIVGPEDVDVLSPAPGPVLTLVTCYPFYFVGPAPRRFIVQATSE